MWCGYKTPNSIEEALGRLAEYGPAARIIAGGTDILVEMRRSPRPETVLLDVTRIGRLDRVWLDERDWIHLGPTVTHNQAAAASLLAARGGPLAWACAQVGTPQVRNRATIAGNLVTASPPAPACPPTPRLPGRRWVRFLNAIPR